MGAIASLPSAPRSYHLAGFWVLAGLWLAVAALGAVAMAWGGWLTGLAAQRIHLRLPGPAAVSYAGQEPR